MRRRTFLSALGAGLVGLAAGLPEGAVDSAVLEALPGKNPLIKRSYRPPNYETPLPALSRALTPNQDFFVRYHLSAIPRIDPAAYRLTVGGLELSLEALRREFEPAEVVAVCQCSGNRRGLSQPHVPGVQWGYGAVGNARWRGVRLKDLLERAGLPAGAVEVSFAGSDAGVVKGTPRFVKSIPVEKALDPDVLVALDMNGEPLPHWNGFPARLVIPGWTATYWMKHLARIEILEEPLDNFWMEKAYRVPARMFPTRQGFPSQTTPDKVPITEIVVNSVIATPAEGARVTTPLTVRGVAWDGGYGIREVDVSLNGGPFQPARLGEDLGRFSFREWSFPCEPRRGPLEVRARATNNLGRTQASKLIWNPAGYHNNVIHTVRLEVV